jgi:hypothetical protein
LANGPLFSQHAALSHTTAFTNNQTITTNHSTHHHASSPGGVLHVQPLALEYVALHVSYGIADVEDHVQRNGGVKQTGDGWRKNGAPRAGLHSFNQ